jgi:hypothetical protein
MLELDDADAAKYFIVGNRLVIACGYDGMMSLLTRN